MRGSQFRVTRDRCQKFTHRPRLGVRFRGIRGDICEDFVTAHGAA